MDRVLLITGASRGIGAATARLAGAAGYSVCVNYWQNRKAAGRRVTAPPGRSGCGRGCDDRDGSPMDYVDDLIATVSAASTRLRRVADTDAARRQTPGAWSAKEVIGHLIDSASNNHQRFVRASGQEDLVFPGYDQDVWVSAQEYRLAPWTELLDLWKAYNDHLARVMRATPGHVRLQVHSRHNFDELAWQPVPRDQPTSLDYLMRDYVDHLRHHVRQIDAMGLRGAVSGRTP